MLRLSLGLACACLVLLTTSCSWLPWSQKGKTPQASSMPATTPIQQDFRQAETLMSQEKYHLAVDAWQKVRDHFASPQITALAELQIGNALFLDGKYTEAVATFEEFIKEHPQHPRVSEALYQLIRSHYQQMLSANRDKTAARNSFRLAQRLLQQYPQHPQTTEVRQIKQKAYERLAAHELYVGRYYTRIGEAEAAIQRLHYLLEAYPQSKAVPEGLFQLARAYDLNDQPEKAQQMRTRLAQQTDVPPELQEALRNYQPKSSLWRRLFSRYY